ncbi:invasin domain 3-containing protein [Aquirufa nivalisilvae]
MEKNSTLEYPKVNTSTELSLNFHAPIKSQAGMDVVFFDQTPGKPKSPEELRIIHANKEVNKLLFQLFQKSNYQDLLFSYFPGNKSKSDLAFTLKVEELRNAVLNQGFNIPVQLLNWSVINGAMAAFANHGPTGKPIIFFNEEYVAGKASFFYPEANDRQMVGLLLQEYGHAIDFYLNGEIDSPGDEGALFAAQEMGYTLAHEEINGAKLRDDSNRILVYGKSIHVEEAALVTQTIWPAAKGSGSTVNINGAKVSGSNFRFETVCTGGGTNCNFSGTAGGGGSAVVTFTYKTTGGSISSPVTGEINWRDQSGSPNSVYFNQYSSGTTLSNQGYIIVLLVNATTNAYTSSTSISGNNGPAGTALDSYATTNAPSTATSTLTPASTTGVIADQRTTTLTVTAKNAGGTALTGATVTLAQFSDVGLISPTTKSTISPSSATTDASGIATFTVSSTIAPQTIYYQATVVASGFESILTGSASVGYVVGPVAKLQVLMPGETADPGSATGKTGTPTDQVAGSNTTVTVNAVDAWWNKITASTPTVVITTSDANDTHPSSAALSAGTGTFTVSFRTAGNQTVTATDQAATLTANTGSTTLVTAGTVNKLQVIMPGETAAPGTTTGKTGTPTAQTAGSSFNFTVNAVDAYWNLVSSATPTAVITSSDGQATLPSSAALASGTKQFALTFKTSGNQTVTATDQAATLTANTGSSTVVNAGTASKLSYSVQPSNATASSSISPAIKVRIEDANGNLTSSTANVTLAIGTNPASGTLSGTLTQAAVAGEATFSNISINNTGTGYTLVASSGALTTATSNTFNIVTSTPSKLTFGTQPANTVAGATMSNVTVRIEDASNNLVSTATNSVTLAINTNPGSGTLSGTVTRNAVNGIATFNDLSINKTGTGYNFSATSGVLTGTTSSNFNITPGAADATASTLTPTSASITANGSSTQVLTVTAKDANGNNLTAGGSTVTITKSSGTGTISSVTDNGNGTYTATVTSPTATGSGVFVATLGAAAVKSGTGSQTQSTITYTPGAADATASTLTPTSASIVANGSSTQVLTVTAKDANGNNLTAGGSTVTITKSSGTGTISSVTDNGNGTYTATVTSPTASGSGVFVATLGAAAVKSGTGSQTQSTITYTAGTATKLVVSTISGQTAGTGFAVTVTLTDVNGNPVLATADGTVTLSLKTGTGTLGGTVTGTITLGSSAVTISGVTYTKAETGVELTATGSVAGNVSGKTGDSNAFNVVAGAADATTSTLTPTSASIVANGSSTQVLTVTAKDANGNNLTAGGSTVTITKSSGIGTISSVTDNGNGTYTATVTSSTATGSGVFVATLGAAAVKSGTGSQTQSTITYTPGAADATASTLTPTSASITANGSSTQVLTVTAKDANGNNLTAGGSTVTITKSSGTGTISSVTDNGNGTYTATVTSPTATGSGVFVATLGAAAVKSGTGSQTQSTITYTPGAADATASTLTPTSASITANGSSTQVLTVTAKDANGNNLTAGGSTVTITKSSGTGTISSVTDNGNGTYTATVTSPTASGSGVFVATLGAAAVKSGTGSQTQSTITYTAGTATKLVVSTISGQTAGTGFAVTVTLTDVNGNPVLATADGTVTLSLKTGTGTLGGTVTGTITLGSSAVTISGVTYTKAETGVELTATGSVAGNVSGKTGDSNAFNVVAGAADATTSTLTPTSASIVANGSSTQVLTVTAKDANGNNLTAGGSTVTITKSSGIGTISSVTDNGNGTYTATVTSPTATGSGVFVATLGAAAVKSGTGSQTQSTITYTPGAADATASTLTPTSASIVADGSTTQVLTVTAKDANGNNLTAGGSTVTITRSSGTGTIGSVTDNSNGTYTATVTSPTAAGSGVFVATLGAAAVKSGTGSQTQSTITYTAGTATKLVVSNIAQQTAGTGFAVTVTLTDVNGNPVLATADGTVTLTRKTGTGTLGGTVTGTILTGNSAVTISGVTYTKAETGVELTATGSVAGNVSGKTGDSNAFNVVAGAATQLAISNISTQTAGTGFAVTVTLLDANGNTVNATADGTVTLTLKTGNGTLGGTVTGTILTGNSAVTISGVTYTKAETGVVLTATGSVAGNVNGKTGDSNAFNIIPGAADATASTLTPTSASIVANGSSTQVLTVTAKDANGNNLTAGGSTVTITKSSGTGTISSVTDNGNGTYTATVTSPTATGSGVFVATLGAAAVKSGTGSQTQSTITYTPGAADATASTLTPTSASIVADGSTTQVLTVTAKDANGNNLTAGGSTVTITKSSGTGTIGSVTDNSNGTYTATVTSPTAAGSGVFVATLGAAAVKSGTGSQTQSSITYTAGTATKLVVSNIAQQTAGTGFAVTVTLTDVNGNPVLATADGTVTLTRKTGTGTLGGTVTGTILTGNSAVTISGVTYTKAETGVELTATGSVAGNVSGKTGDSNAFNVVAGAATQLAISNISTQTAGTGFAVTVTLLDANGNTVNATADGTVTLTLKTGNGTLGGTVTGTILTGNSAVTISGVTYTKAETGVVLTATGSVAGNVSGKTGDSNAFTVNPGAVDAAKSTISPIAASITANGSSTQVLTITAKDANSNNVGVGGATVIISRHLGTGVVGSVSDVGDGTYTATVTSPTTVGTGEFIATIDGTNVQNGTGSRQHSVITYTVGAAAKLSFQVQPSNTASQASINPAVKVRIEDINGNLTTSTANVTIDFGTNAGSGTLSGTKTVAAVSGVATFSDLSINNTANGYTLTATSSGLTSATSNTFNISNSGAAKLAFSVQPSNATAGSSISPAIKVQILDAAGNPTTATDNITLSIDTNPASGTLSGTLTQAAVAGEATFSDISINKSSASAYKLKATSGSLTETISNTFIISPNTPTTITVTDITPSVGVMGINNNIVRVNLLDAYGNFSPAPSDIGVELSLFIGATDRTSDGIERTNASNVVQSNPIQATIPTSSYYTDISYVRYKVSTIDKTTNPYSVNTNATIKAAKYTVGGPGLTTGTSAAFRIVEGKIYSPKTTGNWNAVTWAISSDGGTSFTDTVGIKYIYDKYDIVKIPTGITTTLSQDVSLYSMIIDGTFDLTTSGTLTLNHHSGIDGEYNVHTHGTFKNSGGTFTNTNESGNGYLPNFHGGTYWHARDGGAIPKALWNTLTSSALTKVTGLSSTSLTGGFDQAFLNFEWDNSYTGQIMHGNVSIAKDFYLKSGSFSIGDNNTLTLNETVNGSSGGKLKGTTLSTLHVNTTSGSPTLDFASGGQSLKELKVNVTGGTSLTIPSDLNINNTLNLVSGHVVMGNNKKIILPSDASITGASDTRYVEGTISRVIPKQTDPSVSFPIGDATAYTPVTLDFVGRSAASSDLTIESSTNSLADNTSISGSGIRGDKYVKRKWRVTDGSGAAANGFTTYNITLGFPNGDIAGSASLSNMIVRKNSGSWKAPSGHVRVDGTTKTIKGQGFNSFSDFFIGETTGATNFTLNSPADITTGTRAAYVGTRLDAASLPYTTGTQTAYLTSTNSGVFYDAASGGNVITSIDFADGSSTVNFWFEKNTVASYTVTMSDATPADAGAGVVDATDDIAVTVGAVDATASTLTPTVANITANGSSTQVLTVTAKDAYGNTRSSGGDVVTITKQSGTGSISSVSDVGNGTYTATVTSPSSTGTGVFVATLGGAQVKNGTGSQTQSTITYSEGAASKLVITNIGTKTAGATFSVIVNLTDANGNTVNATADGTVTLSLKTGTGTLGGTLTGTIFSGRSDVTFTGITYTKAETGVVLTVTGSVAGNVSGKTGDSNAFNVVAGAADATASTLTPTSASIVADGSTTQVLTVTAKDANGNNLTAGGSTVTITKSSGTGTISSVTDNSNGTYTATVTSPTAAGSGVFVATLGAAAVKSGTGSQTQSTITYTAGTATKLVVSTISGQTAGTGFAVTVTLTDVNGNPVLATADGTVTLSLKTGTGTLGGTVTGTITLGSSAVTISGVTYTKAETGVVLTATGSVAGNVSGKTGDSNAFNVVAGAADATASTLTPTSASIVADGSTTQVLTVTAKDANGNSLTAGGSTVTITKSSGTGTISSVTDNSNGTYTATVTSPTAAGSGVFVATLGAAAVKSGTGSQTQSTITYTAGTATKLVVSTISGQTAGTGFAVTVTLTDVNGNPVLATADGTVTLSLKTGTGTLGGTVTGTITLGSSAVTISGVTYTKAETGVVLTATGSVAGNVSGKTGDSNAFNVVAGAADATASTLTPTSASIVADGSTTQVLTVTAKDANGNSLTAGGSTVTITKSSGTGTISSVTDNSNGTYTATVTSPTAAGSGVFVATLGAAAVKSGTGSQTQSTITYTAGTATKLVVSNIAQQTAGTGFAVTVTLTDVNGNPVLATADGTVTLSLKTGTGTLGGTVTGTITLGSSAVTISGVTYTKAETGVVLTATGSVAGNVSGKTGDSNAFNVVAGAADATASTLTPTSASIVADGSTTQVLTVTAKDANGNSLTTGGSIVTITKSSGTGTISSVTDNSNGTYTATVTSPTAAGSGVFVATLGAAAVKSGTGSQTQSTITYTAGTATKLVVSTISGQTAGTGFAVTVTLTDVNGNPVLATADGTVTLSLKTGTGTLGGTVTGTITLGSSAVTISGVTYTKAETGVVLTATGSVAGNVSGKTGDSNAFNVVAGAADATASTLTPTSASIVADGSTTQVLTVTAKDANGNNLTAGGSTVTITKSSGTGTISSVTDNSNGTYTATVTSPTAAGSGVFVATLGAAAVKSGTGSQTQSTITYTAGTATKLVVSTISGQTAGTGFAVTVTLTDVNGNPVLATADGTVTLSLKTGTGTLGGTVTGTITLGSSAVTISGVTYTKAETGVVLTATGSVAGNVSGKTGDSNAFNVVPGAASKYLVTSSNYSPVVSGTVTITAQLVDANNNPVSTSNKTVTWSKSDANGSFSSATSTTDANGTATVTFTAHTVANTVTTITATDNTSLTGTTSNITSDASGASKLVISTIAQQTAGTGFSVIVTLTDANGNAVNATADGTVTLTRKTGTGTLGGTLTGTILSGNSAVTISGVTYTKAETGVVLTATGSVAGNVNGKVGDSNTFTVVAGAGAKYIVTSSNTSPIAGSTVTITAQLVDANNNPVTTSNKTVTWSKSDANGSFSSATSTTDANGTATVTFTTHTVSGTSTTITATDNTSLTGTSAGISSTVGTANKLVVSTIAQQTAGTGFSVIVTLTDANGNAVNATADGTVTLTRKTGTGTLGGTVTGTITLGSSAVTISGVTYTKAETGVVLTATGSVAGNVNGKTGDSNAFTVVPGAASKYLVTSSSTSPAAGGTVTITAQLVDANNNPVSTSGKTITWSKSDANGSFSSATSTTDVNGTATVTFTAHTVAGTSTTITATDNTSLTGTTSTITAGSGGASKLVVSTIAQQTAGTGFSVTVTLTDANGNAVNATADGTVTLTRKTGTGTLGGTVTGTITLGSSAVTISGVTYTKAETGVVLTATGSVAGNVSGKTGDSNAFNVVAGAADATASTLTPTSASIVADGSTTQVLTVTAKDANGNSLTAGGATVTITKSSGTGTISSVTDNSNGTYTATVTSPTAAGSGVFVATLGAAAVKSGTGSQTQSTITYTAGTATKLVVSNIAQQTAGTGFAVTVTLTDVNGNPVLATADGTVTLTRKTGTGTLGGTVTGTITLGSSAVTISGVTYTKAETGVVLTATGSVAGNVSGKTGDSNAFTVVPGAASKYLVTSSSTSPAAGGTVTITAQLLDANNNPVSTSGKTITWSKSDANGSFSSATSTTDANGTATVIFTSHSVAGTTTTITATDNTSLTGTSPTITSGSGGATKLVVSTIAGQTAGTAFAVTVTLTDANGNPVNASTNGTVTLTLKSGNGTLGGTLTGTITSGSSAVTISGVTYTKAESGVSLTATGSGSGNVTGKTGDSNTFTVVAGAGAKYIVTSSNTSPTAGGTVTITAQLVDANNNPVTSSGKTVTWSKSDVNGSFSSATSTTDANGIATVTFTTHTVSGTSTTITATDNTSLTGTSAGFSSVAGAASKLVVSTIASQAAGGAFPVTVTLTDANGNPVNATANGTVTLTLKTGTGTLGGTLTGTITAGSSSVTISGVSYTKLESGVVLTATGSGSGNVSGKSGDSNAFNVSAGGANRFIISTITDKVALNTFSVTATLVDANDNLVNADVNTTVTLSVKTGTGTLGGTISGTLLNGNSSVTISGVTYDKVESGVELKATGTSAGNANGKIGNSNAFAVSAGVGSKIKLSTLSNYVAGSSQTITVTLTDDNDNTVLATANGTITISVKTGTGTISGTYTGTILAGTSSVTITGIQYNKAETGIVLRATGTGAGSNVNGKVGDSNAFTVSPGPLYRYFISGLTRQEAGTTQTITIRALDQYDNIIPSYTGLKPITFTGATAASEQYKPSAGAPNNTPTSIGGGTGTLNQTVKKTNATTGATIVNINATAAGNTVVQNPSSNIISLNSTVSSLAEFGSTVNLTFTNGIANAVIILYKAETATISATDGVVNTPKEGELQVEVVNSTFVKLEVTLAPQQTVGQPLVGSLKALDQYGNVVKNFDASQNNITVVVTNLTGNVTGLSGTIKLTSPTDFVNGVADFSLLGVKYEGGSGSGGFTFTPTTGAGVQAENIVVVADDIDGDGVSDEKETTDGTDKNDPCSYLISSQDFSKASLTWKALDCDGDGTANGTDAAPLNSCIGGIPGYIPVKGSLGYQRYFLGDCDGDGITNDMECYGGYIGVGDCQDFDSDGIPNFQDPDSDNDGILDIIEKNIDSDGDGHANYLDLDSDNDGILDSQERTIDSDGDGIPNYLDTDSDNDGIMDAWEATNNTRGVIDSNYDGRVDINGSARDANGNGLADFLESNPAPIPDTDKDGTPDYLDLDSDGDGINDSIELTGDTDKDGKPNYRDKDSDGDWLGDSDERSQDNDGDGVPNYLDLDSDGDGIPDAWEGKNKCATCDNRNDDNDDGWDDRGQYKAVIDTDKDGSPDFLDLDSDNDCIPDRIELGGDIDGDEIPNFRDLDSDGDGIPDQVESVVCENPVDTDKDGTRDFEDLDSDGDGIPDALEAGAKPSTPVDTDKDGLADYRDTDSDGDGILDIYEAGNNPKSPVDTDKDGTPDYLDLDSDGDSIPDQIEGGAAGFKPLDSDNDGVEDFRDLDSDNDKIPDNVEAGTSPRNPVDSDLDGKYDFRDTDSDSDGIPDSVEAGTDPTKPVDTDKDGKADYIDIDSDNDSILDRLEVGSNTNLPIDSDKDGLPDYRDTDSDNDTILDMLEAGKDSLIPDDTDKDGIPDYQDTDSDNDTIPDKVEVGPNTNAPLDTDKDGLYDFRDLDSDGDTIKDKIEAGPDPTKPIDTDKDGLPDYRDLDSDNDGIPDFIEVGKNPDSPVDTDKDGLPDYRDTDSDNDGILDSVSAGTSLNSPLDTDKDGIYDYIDPDDDNDGIPDILEDDLNYGALPDCDHDGIPNRLDPDTCDTFVPQGISPNNDGVNDKLVIPGILNLRNRLSIYNRWGDLVFETENYKNDWGGESSPNNVLTIDKKLPDGVYYYVVDFFGVKPNISTYVFINRTALDR